MANSPVPVVPSVRPPDGVQPHTSAWEDWLGSLLHGFNPGGVFSAGPPASLPVPKSAGGTGAEEPAKTGKPDKQQPAASGGSLFDATFWTTFLSGALKDLQVYGFLLLLMAIGLYGLFAPGTNVTLETVANAPSKLVKRR